ncbi:Aldo/keto reductase [Vararia minispora EC-137]|uniref:Aldo/keto reductase n=1 Tax=Vararia minispora EC-137 TaxID=1314806 RepID=A0ACB8Q8I6_9AGAM|nr:Aldo/keto reductase [Vararia minispora EC-137]
MSTPVPPKMPYVRLGNSGLKVSKIVLGCMSYGDKEWFPWVLDEEEGIKHIKAAYDAGIQSFDTANNYSNGQSEIILGKAIKKLNLPRDEIVVMTKLFFVSADTAGENLLTTSADIDQRGYVNRHGLSRKNVFQSVQNSLKRLQLDYIDLLQCHRFDSDTPIEETMQALHDVVQAGYVRYIGMSSCAAWQYYAISHNITPFISMQNAYNLLYREEEREMMPTLKHLGVGCIPWSPLCGGFLARPLNKRTVRGRDIVNRVEELAEKKGVSMAQVALAWSWYKEPVSAPIIGSTSLDKLHDCIAALNVQLSEEDIKFLEEPYKPKPTLFI